MTWRIPFCLAAVLSAAARAQVPQLLDPESAVVLAAAAKQGRGEYSVARQIVERGLTELPGSPPLLDTLGSIQQDMGDYLLAERSYRRAMKNSTGVLRVRVLNDLATLYLDARQNSKRDRVGDELEMIPLEVLERSPRDAGSVFNTLASIRHRQGDNRAAERLYNEAMAWWRRSGAGGLRVTETTMNLALLYLDSGRTDAAASLLEQTLNGMQRTVGANHPLLIKPLFNLAVIEIRTGRPERAETLARRAAAIASRTLGMEHPISGMTLLLQAKILRQLEHKDEAGELEKRGKAVLERSSARNLSGYTVDISELSSSN